MKKIKFLKFFSMSVLLGIAVVTAANAQQDQEIKHASEPEYVNCAMVSSDVCVTIIQGDVTTTEYGYRY